MIYCQNPLTTCHLNGCRLLLGGVLVRYLSHLLGNVHLGQKIVNFCLLPHYWDVYSIDSVLLGLSLCLLCKPVFVLHALSMHVLWACRVVC